MVPPPLRNIIFEKIQSIKVDVRILWGRPVRFYFMGQVQQVFGPIPKVPMVDRVGDGKMGKRERLVAMQQQKMWHAFNFLLFFKLRQVKKRLVAEPSIRPKNNIAWLFFWISDLTD